MPEHQWDGPIVVPDINRAPADQQHRSSQEKVQKDACHFWTLEKNNVCCF